MSKRIRRKMDKKTEKAVKAFIESIKDLPWAHTKKELKCGCLIFRSKYATTLFLCKKHSKTSKRRRRK